MAATLFASIAVGQDSPVALGNQDVYTQSLTALTILLVLAILLENALAVIFNWRLFLTYFSLRGVRTPIMIVVAWIVVAGFKLDVLSTLINTYVVDDVPSSPFTQFITALIISGGSSGVYSIMRALGYRQDVSQDALTPKPPKTEAWISVRTHRVRARGAILVKVKQVDPQPPQLPSAIAGVVGGQRMQLLDIFFRNPNRFPQSGGYPLVPNSLYEVTVEAVDAAGQPLIKPDVGNRQFVLAPGATIDLDVEI